MITVFAGGTLHTSVGQTVSPTDARAVSSRPEDSLAAEVAWGEGGGYTATLILQETGEVRASHVYQSGGVYNVSIRVSNERRDAGTAAQNILVSGPALPTPTPTQPPLGLLWSYETGDSVHSSPAVAGGTVYVGSDDGHVYALDVTTGDLVWSYETDDWVYSSPTVADGTVYVGSDDS